MKCSVGSSTWITLQPEAASWRSSRFIASAMSQISCFLSSRSYCGVWLSRKKASTWAEQVPNLTGLPAAAAACCAMRQILAYSSGFFGSCSTLPTTRGQRQVL